MGELYCGFPDSAEINRCLYNYYVAGTCTFVGCKYKHLIQNRCKIKLKKDSLLSQLVKTLYES